MSPGNARKQRSYGYVFQAAGLYAWQSIAWNIRLALEIMGYPKAEQAAGVRVYLASFCNKYT
ncbi:hypothetical protein JMM51_03415 [Rhodovulum sulfidophilum]|nr:hypothetical protein [Rhodovulum sulfidophilum]OLS47896.1 hypothetical protein BV379_06085 [Rhodovulum sulfidophilum]